MKSGLFRNFVFSHEYVCLDTQERLRHPTEFFLDQLLNRGTAGRGMENKRQSWGPRCVSHQLEFVEYQRCGHDNRAG
jgi:hypothetical protein